MVSAYHHAVGHPGNTVLRFHAFTGFLIAANKVAELNTGFPQCLLAGQYGTFNIHRQHPIRLDEGDRIPAILLIRTDAVRQAYGNKLQLFIAGFGTQFIDRLLTKFACQG